MGYLNGVFIYFLLYPTFIYSSTITERFTESNITPEDYSIYLETVEDHYKDSNKELRFTGNVLVTFKFLNTSTSQFRVELNVAPKTEVTSVSLKGLNFQYEETNITDVKFNKTDRILTVTSNQVPSGYPKYSLLVHFSNPFQNDMTGFYRSDYETMDGNKRWLVTTHFEPNFARKAFPCFDQPNLKANFKISIGYPASLSNYSVVCNTPVEYVEKVKEVNIAHCAKTSVVMSTYLVAFTVSDFKSTQPVQFVSSYPRPSIRKIVTIGRKNWIDEGDAELSLIAAKDAIMQLGSYLEKGYAFEKIDQIGIPDFSAGAMENWGLISYREKQLFFNEKTGSTPTKQSIVLTITHELVHQWFGNLVTLKSWNYIWLNEAFATYVSYVIADKITSDWYYLKQMLSNEVHMRAFETDGYPSAKPLSHEHENEDLIFSSFNDIPYAKGSSVLRMWDLSLPKDMFRMSLVHYVDKMAQKASLPSDLYHSFKTVAKMDADFFNHWQERPGYPVVQVARNNTILTLTQNRFLWEKPENTSAEYTYTIPITYVKSSFLDFNTVPKMWLKNDSLKLNVTSDWYIINNKGAGYYRVNYDTDNWKALAAALKENEHSYIHELNRAQIINDVFSLARSVQKNYVNYSTALHVAEYLKTESSYVVWRSALHSFDFLLSKMHQEDDIFPQFRAYLLDLLEPHYKEFNNHTERHIDKLMLAQMTRWACSLDYEPCTTKAYELYKSDWLEPDAESVILCTVIRNNNTIWKEVFEKYKNELDSARKNMYLTALGCTGDPELVNNYLASTIVDHSNIRKQDLSLAFASVYSGNFKNVDLAFKFLEKNYEGMAAMYGGINPIGKALTGIARKLHSKEDLKRMEELARKLKANGSIKVPVESINAALEIVKSNQEWNSEKAKQITSYFNSGSLISYSLTLLALCLGFVNQLH